MNVRRFDHEGLTFINYCPATCPLENRSLPLSYTDTQNQVIIPMHGTMQSLSVAMYMTKTMPRTNCSCTYVCIYTVIIIYQRKDTAYSYI